MGYLKDFLLHPTETGSVAPSSRFLARQYCDSADIEKRSFVVEIGPAAGAITETLIRRLSLDAEYFAIEVNPSFVKQFRARFPGVEIHHDSLEQLPTYLSQHGVTSCDCIVSGIPWTNLAGETQNKYTDVIVDSLSESGVFVTMVYIQSPFMPAGRRYRECLEARFSRVRLSKLVYLNFPPAYLYVCEK